MFEVPPKVVHEIEYLEVLADSDEFSKAHKLCLEALHQYIVNLKTFHHLRENGISIEQHPVYERLQQLEEMIRFMCRNLKRKNPIPLPISGIIGKVKLEMNDVEDENEQDDKADENNWKSNSTEQSENAIYQPRKSRKVDISSGTKEEKVDKDAVQKAYLNRYSDLVPDLLSQHFDVPLEKKNMNPAEERLFKKLGEKRKIEESTFSRMSMTKMEKKMMMKMRQGDVLGLEQLDAADRRQGQKKGLKSKYKKKGPKGKMKKKKSKKRL